MLKILITRPRLQADVFADNLARAGMEPIYFPVIQIRSIKRNSALKHALTQLSHFDWVVFTSWNGVEVVWSALSRLKIKSLPENLRVAAIGPKTAQALVSHHIHPNFVPEEYIAEAVVPGMGDLVSRHVLLPRAEIARKALPEAIKKAGGVIHEIAVYRTLPVEPNVQGLQAIREGVDVITLTSPSTVENFIAIARSSGFDPCRLPGDPVYACIGPITAQAAREEGLPKTLVADDYTTDGLLKAIQVRFAR